MTDASEKATQESNDINWRNVILTVGFGFLVERIGGSMVNRIGVGPTVPLYSVIEATGTLIMVGGFLYQMIIAPHTNNHRRHIVSATPGFLIWAGATYWANLGVYTEYDTPSLSAFRFLGILLMIIGPVYSFRAE